MRTGQGHLEEVKSSRKEGRRIYLYLACGHEKLHNPRDHIPYQSYCYICPPKGDDS